MLQKIGQLLSVNWIRTIYFNFSVFPAKKALTFPVLLYGRFSIHALKGEVVIDGPVRMGMIKVGQVSVGIFDKKARTVLNIYGKLVFKGTANIGGASAISVGRNSELILGTNFKITAKSSIIATGGKSVLIGDDCLLSWDILIMSSDFHKIIDKSTGAVVNDPEDIVIGNKVWVGCNTTILKGSVIPDHVVVGAGTIISNKKLDETNAIYAGIPAKKIGNNISWKY